MGRRESGEGESVLFNDAVSCQDNVLCVPSVVVEETSVERW